MNTKCLSVIAVLMLVILGGAYKFIVEGSTSESTDGRLAIHLNASERDLVLKEMRSFLVSVQQIAKGISEDNMDRVSKYARQAGAAAQEEVPVTLVGKLPLEFKKLGFDTHRKFDLLALDAESLGDGNHALKQLTELMENCVGCHAGHRLVAVEN
jgi:hypothetical protein